MDDQKYLDLAIKEAEKSFNSGNYPVGAVLVFDNEVVDIGGNFGETSKNYVNHAETSLLIKNGEALLKASNDGKKITLFTSLEPCLMCLGVATLNKVSRIVYIQKDPLAGACGIDRNTLGARYQKVWPEIEYIPYKPKPKELIVRFLEKQINDGVRVDWSKNFLELLENR